MAHPAPHDTTHTRIAPHNTTHTWGSRRLGYTALLLEHMTLSLGLNIHQHYKLCRGQSKFPADCQSDCMYDLGMRDESYPGSCIPTHTLSLLVLIMCSMQSFPSLSKLLFHRAPTPTTRQDQTTADHPRLNNACCVWLVGLSQCFSFPVSIKPTPSAALGRLQEPLGPRPHWRGRDTCLV